MPKKLTATSYQKAIICMVLAYISIALMGVFVKYASDELPSSEILFSRFLIDFIFLLPFMIRDGDFKVKLRADFFKAYHNDCCSMRYHSRGAEYIPLDKDEREALFAHCNILEALAIVDSPKQVNRIVDINRSLPETVFDDDARSRILAYYGS